MRRALSLYVLLISVSFGLASCGTSDHTVDVAKPRLHKTWPKKHRWHKKIKVWKFTLQMPERGGLKKVKMKS